MAKDRRAIETTGTSQPRNAVLYARVSSKKQHKEGFSVPAQLKLLRDYALHESIRIVEEYVDVETAKQAGRTSFGEMVDFLNKHPESRIILVEKTDRLYRNLKDWVTLDELALEIHFVKEGVVLSRDSRSSEKFMHGIKVLMAKNYIDNLSEETRKGMTEKAEQGIWPSYAPFGYCNVVGENGKRTRRFLDRIGDVERNPLPALSGSAYCRLPRVLRAPRDVTFHCGRYHGDRRRRSVARRFPVTLRHSREGSGDLSDTPCAYAGHRAESVWQESSGACMNYRRYQ